MLVKNSQKLVLCCLFVLLFTHLGFPQIDTEKHVIDNSLDGGYWIYAIDFDKDGDNDILAASLRSGLKWYENDGTGTFTRQNIFNNFSGAWSIHANDLDGDGDYDVVACSEDSSQVAWFENLGDGTFDMQVIDSQGLKPHSIYSADLDGDDDIDIISAAYTTKKIFWYENDGNANFTKNVLDHNFNLPHSVYAADLNNDNKVDIIAGGAAKTAWWQNNGNGNFTKKDLGSSGSFFVIAADINGDGLLDVLRNQRTDGFQDIDWFENNGGSSFTERQVHSNYGETWAGAVGDFDLDGDTDIVAAGFVPNKVSYWLNDGNENFTKVDLDALTRPRGVAVADFDNDGDEDMATVTRSDMVIWYEVLGSPTVTDTITVTSPNGGEVYEIGSNVAILWTNTGTINNVKLQYSTDGGTVWNIINASTANTGSYNWTIPGSETNNALVRVTDAGNPAISDISDNVFSIVSPAIDQSLTITSPNGGESWFSQSTQTITWDTTGAIDFVKLEYSPDNGTTWFVIVASVPNTKSYSWSLPDIQTNEALVRISDAADGVPSDISDGVFTIEEPGPSSLTLVSPNGGETWAGASTQAIAWTSTGQINNVKLEYSLNNGGSWVVISNSAPNTGTYNWSTPNIPSTTVVVKISDATNASTVDVSDNAFTIQRTTLSVFYPNGGENWNSGSTQSIRWNTTGPINIVDIEYSLDNGTNWTTIATDVPNNGNYDWVVPNINSTTAVIRVSDAPDALPSDVSDGVFTITGAELAVTSPNGGENWFGGSTHNITWTSNGLVDNVKIEYSADNGTTWTEIISSTPNSGSYQWIVPENQSSTALVRISDAADGHPSDVSNGVFSITESNLTVTAPNGGEIMIGGSTKTITWNSTGSVDSVKLEFSTNNGEDWVLVAASSANTGSFSWTVPNFRTDNALVRISDAADGIPVDVSDNVFTIISSSLTITSPNGDEIWLGANTYNVTWHSTGVIDHVKLEYSLNNGTSWTDIADNLSNNGSYAWSVPNVQSETALVRISDVDGMGPPDISDATFTINKIVSDVSINRDSDLVPEEFGLMQNYPNPFNLETKINFALPKTSKVTLSLFNMRGELIQTLFDGHLGQGVYTSVWNGRDQNDVIVPSGLYIYNIRIGDWQASKKLLLVK